MIHWTKIKKAVEDNGGTWTDRAAGEAFLVINGIVLEESEPAPATPAVTFDASKPHGTFHGEDARYPGAKFSQGGHYFNAQGKKVG